MSEWKEYKIGDFAISLNRGFTPNYTENELDGYIVLNQKCIRDSQINFQFGRYYNKNQKVKESAKIKIGDILINSTGEGTLGRSAIVSHSKSNLAVDSHITILRVNKELVSPAFISKFITLAQPIIENFAGGSTGQTELSRKDIANLNLKIPTLPTQHLIASILSAYDDLIENNNRRIALLEQMAEQIYKEWFVRLRFPGYENTDFEKGVPKGWKIKCIKDFGRVVTGKTPSTFNSRYYGGNYLFIKTPDMQGNIFTLQTEETLTEDGFKSQKSQIIPKNSIFVNCIGAGAGLVSITSSICMTNQQINSIILKNQNELEFLFFVCRGMKTMIEMVGSTGATMTNVSKGKFEKLKLIKPSDYLIQDFSKKTKPMFQQIENLMKEQLILKQTRDLLLPRLIGGKLRVKDVEMKL